MTKRTRFIAVYGIFGQDVNNVMQWKLLNSDFQAKNFRRNNFQAIWALASAYFPLAPGYEAGKITTDSQRLIFKLAVK